MRGQVGIAVGLAAASASACMTLQPISDPQLTAAATGWAACLAATQAGVALEELPDGDRQGLTAGDIALYPPGQAGPLRPWWQVDAVAARAARVGVIDTAKACTVVIVAPPGQAVAMVPTLAAWQAQMVSRPAPVIFSRADRAFIASLAEGIGGETEVATITAAR
jgi:hypothetical protein